MSQQLQRYIKGSMVRNTKPLGWNARVPVGTELEVRLGIGAHDDDYDYLLHHAEYGLFFGLHSELEPVGEPRYTTNEDDFTPYGG